MNHVIQMIQNWLLILENIILKNYMLLQTKTGLQGDNQNNSKQDSVNLTNWKR